MISLASRSLKQALRGEDQNGSIRGCCEGQGGTHGSPHLHLTLETTHFQKKSVACASLPVVVFPPILGSTERFLGKLIASDT